MFAAEDVAKDISFVSNREPLPGFVRVIGGDEGFTYSELKKFHVPAGHELEVLGCRIMFTRA
jgi:hypothetical protein